VLEFICPKLHISCQGAKIGAPQKIYPGHGDFRDLFGSNVFGPKPDSDGYYSGRGVIHDPLELL
jgi:hypothetical protein